MGVAVGMMLTPKRLAAVYDMLRAFPPFNRWKLPESSEVKFHLAKTKKWDADWWIVGERHNIRISQNRAGHLNTVICSMAHEMIHAHQRAAKTETPNTAHNAEFLRLADAVAKRYGWDPKSFV